MKKICVVTGSRADYGLLKYLIKYISVSNKLKLQLLVTGSHLSKKFGNTINFIKTDGFKIECKVNMKIKSDTTKCILKSMSIGINNFAKALNKLKPDALLILGDRYEVFTAATSAMISGIPIIHLHGGESTEGSIDEAMRHSITKMSHLHFVSTEIYKNRVMQLGENPKKIFNVGAMAMDGIKKIKYLKKKQLEKKLKFTFLKKNLLITFHPATLEYQNTPKQIEVLLNVLSEYKDTGLIFTMPNSDTSNSIIYKKIKNFCSINKNAKYFLSLGHDNYLSTIQYVDAVVGNSSSGIIEVPSFKKGTINIGDRQQGRLKAKSIIDCKINFMSIKNAINFLYSKIFQKSLKNIKNPYDRGEPSKKIINILEKQKFNTLLKKSFYKIV
jgi:GDP/UDP-N,N'-diacetylbacillosamine 2-epimerase (hydrolysing)